jgi:hypothetical protein
MPLTLARSTVQALSSLITLVRDEISDPATFPSGASIPEKQRRWTDTRITRAIHAQIADMANAKSPGSDSENLQYTDFTYTADAFSVTLPSVAALVSAHVYKLEDISDTSNPAPCEYVSPLDLDNLSYDLRMRDWRLRWTLLAGPSASESLATSAIHVAVRPRPSANLAMRVWTFAPAILTAATTDTLPQSDRWFELISLGAARKLLRVDNEFTEQQEGDFQRLWVQYVSRCDRNDGPVRVRRQRGIYL